LNEAELFGPRDKVAIAIARIREFEPMALQNNPAGYYVCVSGGKDSSVIQELCIMAGVKCEFVHNHTSADHPETIYFVRREKERVEKLGHIFRIEYPRDKNGKQLTMWSGIVKNGLPTRLQRWCCGDLKEFGGVGRYCIMGIRSQESVKRKHQRILETCYKKQKVKISPIIDWSETDVWDFIKERGVPFNPLYNCGHTRVGCIGCPQSTRMKAELEANPKYKALYFEAAKKHIEYRKRADVGRDESVEEYFAWWVSGKQLDRGETLYD
jgi:phosphoadenosine phosphosulfate reductase